MIRAYIIEFLLLGGLVWLFCWGVVKLWFLIKREASIDNQINRQIKREADEALDDLERAEAAHRKEQQ